MKKWMIIGILLVLLIGIFPFLYFLDNQLVEQYVSSYGKNNELEKEESHLERNKIEIEEKRVNNLKPNDFQEIIPINLLVNSKSFRAILYDNETTQEWIKQFPMTFQMKDLHSNEKYYYMESKLKTNVTIPDKIQAGDIKLYEDNCIVIFYQTFQNPGYQYTDLGYIEEMKEFISEIKSQKVSITMDVIR